MQKTFEEKCVYVAGHNGMVGSAIIKKLKQDRTVKLVVRDRVELDLLNQTSVEEFFRSEDIDEMYIAAAKVGGIHANSTYPADFIYQNLMIQCNLINAAHLAGVQKILFLGSSCIYPKSAEQPMSESCLLTGPLESTNEPYAIAKIAGIKLCESYNRQYDRDYRSVMPTNLYGPNDNFHPENSHVIPGLIRRFHKAKVNKDDEVIAWGSGKPMREFLYVDDMASACLHVMALDKVAYAENTEPMLSHINIGTGFDISIKDLVEAVAKVVGFNGVVKFDANKPDGTKRKLMDVRRLERLNWEAKTTLNQGLEQAYKWFLENVESYRE